MTDRNRRRGQTFAPGNRSLREKGQGGTGLPVPYLFLSFFFFFDVWHFIGMRLHVFKGPPIYDVLRRGTPCGVDFTLRSLSENWVRLTSRNRFRPHSRNGRSAVRGAEAARRGAPRVPPAGPRFLSCLRSGHPRPPWPTLGSPESLSPAAGPGPSQEPRVLGRRPHPASWSPRPHISSSVPSLVGSPVKPSLCHTRRLNCNDVSESPLLVCLVPSPVL